MFRQQKTGRRKVRRPVEGIHFQRTILEIAGELQQLTAGRVGTKDGDVQ